MSRRDRRTLDLGGAALGLQASLTVFSKLVMGGSAGGDEDDAGRCVQDEEHDEQRGASAAGSADTNLGGGGGQTGVRGPEKHSSRVV